MTKLRDIEDSVLIEACQRFIKGEGAQKIRDWLEEKHGFKVSREKIYPLLEVAMERKYFRVLPPPNEQIGQRIGDRYRRNPERIRVVNSMGRSARDYVCNEAAELTVSLIKELGKRKGSVHIGLGGGQTIRETSQALAALLKSEEKLPPLVFHVVSSGLAVDRPRTAPITYLSFFEKIAADIKFVGLFAPPVVATEEYDDVSGWPGIVDSFNQAKSIDIFLTSIASALDPHGALRQFADAHRRRGFKISKLEKADWVGDLQYRPYGKEGAVDVDAGVRAVTLFELDDLRMFAKRKNKYVIVVAGPCATCHRSKSDALLPLLQCKELDVWTHLVVDLQTAYKLLPPRA